MAYLSIAERAQRDFQKSKQTAMSEAQMDEMRQQIQDDQYGIGDFAIDALKKAASATLWTLDSPRRAVQAVGWAAAGRDWADAWELAENGANILTEGLGYESPEDSWGSWGAGLALDIATDPLMYFGISGLTKGGKAAKKAGKLGLTWAEQAKAGQRAALTLWTPWETLELITSPAFVRAEAALGQKVANAPIIKGLVRRFTTKSLDPRVRRLVDEALERAPDDIVDAFKWRDEQVHGILSQVSPDDITDVVSLAEANGKSGGWAKRIIADSQTWSPLKRAQGVELSNVIAAGESLANSKGIAGEPLGAAIIKQVRNLENMDNKAWDALEDGFKADVLQLSNKGQARLHQARAASTSATKLTAMLSSMKGRAGRRMAIEGAQGPLRASLQKQADSLATSLEKTMQRGYDAAGEIMKGVKGGTPEGAEAGLDWLNKAQVPDLLRNVSAQLRSGVFDPAAIEKQLRPVMGKSRYVSVAVKLRDMAKRQKELIQAGKDAAVKWTDDVASMTGKASKAQAEAIRSRWLASDIMKREAALRARGIVPTDDVIKTSTELAKFRAAQDNLPNWIPRSLTPKARDHLKAMGVAGKDNAKVWQDKALGKFEREMGERLVDGNKTEYLRQWSIPEIAKGIEEAGPGGRLERWRGFLNDPEGVFGFIDRLFKRPKDLRKMYNLDPIGMINKMADDMATAIKGKKMFEVLQESDELFSKEALPGWFHVKELGQDALQSIGGGYIKPDAFHELRRVYTNLTNPENRTILGKAWQSFTKFWKWSVTRAFPAYHARNHIEDTVRMMYNGPFNPVEVHENMMKGLAKKGNIKLGGKMMPIEDAWRIAEANGVVNTGEVAVGAIRRPDGTMRTIDRAVDALMAAPEDGRRFGYWAERVNKGFSHFQASQEVKRVLFDYSELSQFERGVMSQLIPFYTYMRNTIRLHAQTAIQNPGLLMAQKRVMESVRGDAKPEGVPEWARSRLFIAAGPGERTGEERMIAAYGLPIQDMMELLDADGGFMPWVKQLSWRLHPLIKLGMDIKGAGTADRPGYAPKVFKHLPSSVKEMIGVQTRKAASGDEYVTIDPIYSTLLDAVGARAYSTMKSLGRNDMGAGEQTLKHLLGVSVVDYDPQVENQKKKRLEFQSLIDRMVRRGDLAPIPGFYKPRSSTVDEQRLKFLQAERKGLRR